MLEVNKILNDYVGNKTSATKLIKSFNNSNFSGVWLLRGPKGIGKAKLAHVIISELLNIDTNNSSSELIHPDLFLLKHNSNDKKFISVDNVRKISSFLSKTSIKGNYRSVLIDSLSEINLFGYNALLKTIEDYSSDTSFFLIDHMVSEIPATINSRCKTFTFKKLNNKNLSLLLKKTNVIKEEDHHSYSILANGSLGEAINLHKFNALNLHEIYCKFILGENNFKSIQDFFRKKDNNIFDISFLILYRLLTLTLKYINGIKEVDKINQLEEKVIIMLSETLNQKKVLNLIDSLNLKKQNTTILNLDLFTAIHLFFNELKENINKNE